MLEFFVFLGYTFFTYFFEGLSDFRDWWSTIPIEKIKGAICQINEYISFQWFNVIIEALCLTSLLHSPFSSDFIMYNK